MTPSYAIKHGIIRYRYYVCSNALQKGRNSCPSQSIRAGQIEQLVLEQIRRMTKDPALMTNARETPKGSESSQGLKVADPEKWRLYSPRPRRSVDLHCR
jgi:hypothetical protein